jgi:hypothetical protein
LAKRGKAVSGLAAGGETAAAFGWLERGYINMNNEKYTDKEKQDARAFLEGLSKAELRGVMDSPIFNGFLMEHVEESELLTKRVTELLEEEYSDLSEEEQAADQSRIARLVQGLMDKYAASQKEGEFVEEFAARLNVRPASSLIDHLLTSLKRYIRAPEGILQEWIAQAQANAQLFLRGLDIPGLDHAAEFDHARRPEMPAVFKHGDATIQLDKRDEIDHFVVEVSTFNELLCGREIIVLLIGQTGETVHVPVRLDERRGGTCFGKEIPKDTIVEMVTRLGSVIVPVIQTSGNDPTGF